MIELCFNRNKILSCQPKKPSCTNYQLMKKNLIAKLEEQSLLNAQHMNTRFCNSSRKLLTICANGFTVCLIVGWRKRWKGALSSKPLKNEKQVQSFSRKLKQNTSMDVEKSKGDCCLDESKLYQKERRQIKRNFALICFGAVLVLCGFSSFFALQTSINVKAGLGEFIGFPFVLSYSLKSFCILLRAESWPIIVLLIL